MEQPRKAVVVTGFGPFGEHTVNASWIAVQELEKLGLGDSVDLHVYEIPVEYKTVQRLIPALWEKHSPQLVVHVGVSGMATTVTLEKCGHNKGYKGLDNCRFCPGSQCCVEDGPESIDSIIDMDAVCKRVTTLGLDVSVTISQDAGRPTHPSVHGLSVSAFVGSQTKMSLCEKRPTEVPASPSHRSTEQTHRTGQREADAASRRWSWLPTAGPGAPTLFAGLGPEASGFRAHALCLLESRGALLWPWAPRCPGSWLQCPRSRGCPHLEVGKQHRHPACPGGTWHGPVAPPTSQVSILS
ncbi:pyroglutamyl-peptidase 1 isoform X2 [Manis javanica]|uniref:pyroglutamyl-peptidase 1 isoform X2 n=1 Tax=Manis javanica TaxID=9974 RepID=UPI001879D7BA|nr:pyroglutamyl-peptidase 1 isoform X2 [Manis javanica]